MTDAGFLPWIGDDYGGQYEADETPGVWRDRRRLFVLDRPKVPSIIVETHNARDGREPERWQEPRTHEVP
jgi:N-acetylmuramoyl-L-alanine amidase